MLFCHSMVHSCDLFRESAAYRETYRHNSCFTLGQVEVSKFFLVLAWARLTKRQQAQDCICSTTAGFATQRTNSACLKLAIRSNCTQQIRSTMETQQMQQTLSLSVLITKQLWYLNYVPQPYAIQEDSPAALQQSSAFSRSCLLLTPQKSGACSGAVLLQKPLGTPARTNEHSDDKQVLLLSRLRSCHLQVLFRCTSHVSVPKHVANFPYFKVKPCNTVLLHVELGAHHHCSHTAARAEGEYT
jgi:hypothetical protein